MKLLIKNGRVIDPQNGIDETLDILVSNGKILSVDKKISVSKDVETFDASGFIVAPGFIDLHCHLREPGYERKETIESGLNAALYGGFTAVCCMANTNPVNDNAGITNFILEKAKKVSKVKVYPVGALSKGQKGEELANYAEMKQAGVWAVSDDGNPVMNTALMRHSLEYAGSLGLLVIDHAEDKYLSEGGAMNEGETATRLGLRGIPSEAELIQVRRDTALSRLTGQRIHIAHVSSKYSVESIRVARKRKIMVTADVTPHHFTLTEEEVKSFDTNYKMNPPLRTEEDIKALVEGLNDGTIDCIATDHAPHAYEEKMVEFDKAPNGIIGFQTAVPLAIEKLVLNDQISLKRMVDAFSSAPARIIGLQNKGNLSVGSDADLTIFSLRKETLLKKEDIKSLSKNSPFIGRKIKGAVMAVVIDGNLFRLREK
ncbi:MAG: dihydroorotase [Thermoanaerobaculaceae bacterium]|nr:dihydroorotase [Thermoanaerobaculaceae bacterium]